VRVLIADDERPARDKLRRLLALENDIDADGIVDARDGVEALACVAAHAPEVLFLDIQMPEMNGFDVAACLPAPAPLVVFVTAYDEHAVRAFDANAIDYLLKPYDQERLQRALQRVRARLAAEPAPPAFLQQLLVTQRGVTRLVKTDEVEWIETADNYVYCTRHRARQCCARPWPGCSIASDRRSSAATGAPPCASIGSKACVRTPRAMAKCCCMAAPAHR
jgi:two-component system LytT family response regulator